MANEGTVAGKKAKKAKKEGWLAEFKKFVMRGNVIDLAVGIIIGGAFGKIVTALVDNIFMPVVGALTGGIDFKSWSLSINVGENKVELLLGTFVGAIVDFLLVALCVFAMVKLINAMRREREPEKPAEIAPDIALLTEIRDLLKNPSDER